MIQKLVEQAELDLATVDDAAMEAKGPIWECHGCTGSRWSTTVRPTPVTTSGLTWSELVSLCSSLACFRRDAASRPLTPPISPQIRHAFQMHDWELKMGSGGLAAYARQFVRLQKMGTEIELEKEEKPLAGPSTARRLSMSPDSVSKLLRRR